MKTNILSKFSTALMAGAMLLAACFTPLVSLDAQAQSVIDYGYVTKSASGTTTAEVIFPANDEASLRLLSYDYRTDLASAPLVIYSGTRRYDVLSNSLSTATNIIVRTNTSISSNDVVVVQAADGTTFSATVWGTGGGTNIYLTGQLGTAVAAGASVYRMSASASIYPGSTNETRIAGEAIYGAQLRMPLLGRITGTSACRINALTVKYDE